MSAPAAPGRRTLPLPAQSPRAIETPEGRASVAPIFRVALERARKAEQ